MPEQGKPQTISERKWLAIIVGGSLLLRAALAFHSPLLQAEAYYWTWSQHLDWGFFDHPPGVAVAMRAFGWLVPHSAFAVRLGSVVVGTAWLLVAYAFLRRFATARTALLALFVAAAAPIWLPLGVLALPDGPLLLFWTLSLLLFHRAYRGDAWHTWLLAGLATGLAILSKYNGFQLPLVFFAFLIATPRGRALLRGPRPYAALSVTLAVVAPNLLWDSGHGSSTATMPFYGGLRVEQAAWHLGEWAVLPFLCLTPLVAWAWVRRAVAGLRAGRLRGDEDFLFLCCASLLPLAMFAVVAVVTQVHLQWVATCFVAALPIAFETLDDRERGPPGARFLRWAAGSCAGITLLVAALPMAVVVIADATETVPEGEDGRNPGPMQLGVLGRGASLLRGWDELAERLDSEIAARGAEGSWFLSSDNFHLVAMLEHMTRGRIPAYPSIPRHRHQYGVRFAEEELVGRDALYVEAVPASGLLWSLRQRFESFEMLDPVTTEVAGRPVRRFRVAWCRGYRGEPAAK